LLNFLASCLSHAVFRNQKIPWKEIKHRMPGSFLYGLLFSAWGSPSSGYPVFVCRPARLLWF
jgi:hypothetical protein